MGYKLFGLGFLLGGMTALTVVTVTIEESAAPPPAQAVAQRMPPSKAPAMTTEKSENDARWRASFSDLVRSYQKLRVSEQSGARALIGDVAYLKLMGEVEKYKRRRVGSEPAGVDDLMLRIREVSEYMSWDEKTNLARVMTCDMLEGLYYSWDTNDEQRGEFVILRDSLGKPPSSDRYEACRGGNEQWLNYNRPE